MKTNYILLIFLVSVTFSNAQDNSKAKKIESTNIVSQNNEDVSLTTYNAESVIIVNDIETTDSSLARTNSDIRIYLNLIRKVENINLLFPKLNIKVKA